MLLLVRRIIIRYLLRWKSSKGALRLLRRLYGSSKYIKAYIILKDILTLMPDIPNKGNLYVLYAELSSYVNHDLAEARSYLEAAEACGGLDLARFYYIKAWVLFPAGEYEEAIENIKNAIAIGPDLYKLVFYAEILSFTGDPGAYHLWNQVLEKEPDNALAKIYLARIAWNDGNEELAQDQLKVAENDVSSADEYYKLGQLLAKIKYNEKALEAFHTARRLGYQNQRDLWDGIGGCYFSLKRYKECTKVALKALKYDTSDESTKYLLLISAQYIKMGSAVKTYIKKVNVELLSLLLAWEAQREGKTNDAKKITSALDIENLSPAESLSLGHLYYELNDFERALQCYLKAEKSGNREMLNDILLGIAASFTTLDRYEEALSYALKALNINPYSESLMEIKEYCEQNLA